MTDARPARRVVPRWRRRLARNPVATFGLIVIGFFLLMVAFAPFLAPYPPTDQSLRTTYVPPGVGVKWSGPAGEFGLWVHPVTRSPTAGVRVDESVAYPVRWLVRGAQWTWFGGLVTSDLRLFGVDGPVRFHLLGTDEQGRDLLSRLIHGAWISMFVGVISIAIGIGIDASIATAIDVLRRFFEV